MKNNSLSDIVDCTIEISSPSVSDETFDSILIIADAPAYTQSTKISGVFEVSTADELLEYGYTAKEDLYKACSVAFSQSPCPDSLYILARTSADGEVENVTDALTRAAKEKKFYGIYLTGTYTDANVDEAKAWAESNEKLFVFTYTDIDSFPVQNTNYYRTAAFYAGQADGYDSDAQPDENKYLGLAVMAKCFGYDPGTETWAHKVIATVVPSMLGTSDKTTLEEKNASSLRRYAGSNTTFGGLTLAGEWIDVIRFRDWLKSEIQTNVYNVLKANRKVPFTDSGINLIYGAINDALAKGQRIGGIAEDSTDEDENELPGYSITVPKASSFSEAERKTRKLTGLTWTARLSGAIHLVSIHGNLTV